MFIKYDNVKLEICHVTTVDDLHASTSTNVALYFFNRSTTTKKKTNV